MDETVRERVRGHLSRGDAKLRAARALAQLGEIDDPISRAYYAAFHAARAAPAVLGYSPRSHEGVITLFGQHFVQTGRLDRALGRALNRLQDDRQNGDYGIATFFGPEDAQAALSQAEAFLKAVRAWLATEFPDELA